MLSLNMEHVVIFGSQGLLGTALMKQFSGTYEVVGLDRNDLDILDEKQVTQTIEKLKPKLVINAVAYNNVDEAEKNDDAFKMAENLNGQVVGKLGHTTKSLGIPLVHFSSEYVFDGTNKDGYTEKAAPRPINRYGQTKLLGETLAAEATDLLYIIRLSRLFGPSGTSELTKKSFVDIMLDQVEKNSAANIKVVDDEKSCPTYSPDLARFVYDLTVRQKPFGIYHGANSGACTWYILAKEIFTIKGLAVNVVPVDENAFPRPAKRPHYGELISTKLPPQRPWQEALRDYILPGTARS